MTNHAGVKCDWHVARQAPGCSKSSLEQDGWQLAKAALLGAARARCIYQAVASGMP